VEEAGARPQPHASGWNAFFDAVLRELRAYAEAPDEDARVRSLGRLYPMSVALQGVSWGPGRRAARGDARLAAAAGAPGLGRAPAEGGDPGPAPGGRATVQDNRRRWIRLVDDYLGRALRAYEGAETVAARQDALKQIYGALNRLEGVNRTNPWVPRRCCRRR
jgi:hypothetical protein